MADYDEDIWTNKPDMPRNPSPARTAVKFDSVTDPSVRVEHLLDEVGEDQWHRLQLDFSAPRNIRFEAASNRLTITLADRSDGSADMLATALIWMALQLKWRPDAAEFFAKCATMPADDRKWSFPGFGISVKPGYGIEVFSTYGKGPQEVDAAAIAEMEWLRELSRDEGEPTDGR